MTCSNNIPVPDGILRHAVDGPVELPLFDEKAWAFKRGYPPLGIRADECTVKGALIPELLSVTTLSGRSLVPGRDFRVDPEWGAVGLTPEAPREPVRLSYAYTELRLDSLVEKDGQTTRRYGEPHVANPVPPALADGERRVENLLVSANGEMRFPILADAADAPRTAPNAETTIPRTLAKLRSGEPVTILAWGDSVTAATYLPEEERWQSQFVRRLREAFLKSEITLVTRGWGGRNIKNFLGAPAGDEHNFAEAVLSVRPDLVVSEFVNDAGFPPDTAQKLYGGVLADFRANGIEWAILTPHYVRCDWMGLKGQTDCDDDPRPYTAFVRRFVRENGVGLADASLRWGHLWREGIPHETLLRNAINHPNSLGLSFYADALMDFLGPPGAPAGTRERRERDGVKGESGSEMKPSPTKQPSLATRVIELVENARRNLAQAIYATMLRKSSVGSLGSLGTLGSLGPLQLLGTLGNAENKWRLKELPRVPRIPRNPRELRHPSAPRHPGPLRKAEENVPCLQSQIPCLY